MWENLTLYDYFPTKLHVLLFVFEEELNIVQETN